MARWELQYQYADDVRPNNVLTAGTFTTRQAARDRLASMARRCRSAGNPVATFGPDLMIHAWRTTYTVARRAPGPRTSTSSGDATVTHPDGLVVTVLNLGWILRHSSEVTAVAFWQRSRADAPGADGGGRMVAELTGGRTYATEWASTAVFRDWIRRPRFAHVSPEMLTCDAGQADAS